MWRLGGKKSTFTLGPGVAVRLPAQRRRGCPTARSACSTTRAPRRSNRPRAARSSSSTRTPRRPRSSVSSCAHRGRSRPTARATCKRSPAAAGWSAGAAFRTSPNSTPRAKIVYDAQLPAGENSYRVYRLPWSGQPTRSRRRSPRGRRAARRPSTRAGTARPRSPPGSSSPARAPAHLAPPCSTTPRSGFETTIPAPPAAFVQVRALSASGKVLASSRRSRRRAGDHTDGCAERSLGGGLLVALVQRRSRSRSPRSGSPPSRPPTTRPPSARCAPEQPQPLRRAARHQPRRLTRCLAPTTPPPRTQISLLGVAARRLCARSRVERLAERVALRAACARYSQGDGASFVPARPFPPGEARDRARAASARPRTSRRSPSTSSIAHQDFLLYVDPRTPRSLRPEQVQRFHSRPDLQPAVAIAVTARSRQTALRGLHRSPRPTTAPARAGR